MKVVLDTNVILAAFGTRGLCEDVVAVCMDQHELALSGAILAEVRENLGRKFKVSPSHVREIESLLRTHAEMVVPDETPEEACRDPDDCVVLGTATAAGADCIVTGDADLLTIGHFKGVAILSPREFYDGLP